MFIIIAGVGVCLYLFYEFQRVKEERQEDRRESLNERRQEYLEKLIRAKKKEQGEAENPPAAGSEDGASE